MAAARPEPASIPAANGRSRAAAAMAKGRPASPVPLASSQYALRETSLYAPVKRFLAARGFDVKGEICGCDLVALRGNEPPLASTDEGTKWSRNQ